MYLKSWFFAYFFTRFTLVASNLRKKISVKAKKKSLESKPIICKIATRRDSRDVSKISKKWNYFHVLRWGCLCVFLHLNLPLMIFHIRNSKRQIFFLICIILFLLHNPASNESPVKIGNWASHYANFRLRRFFEFCHRFYQDDHDLDNNLFNLCCWILNF